ncbi:hypothetical protein IFM89_039982, partial [Coptis chinensis]
VLPTVVKLFALNDRVYPHGATGFSYTSAFLRELTLKSMLVLAPKESAGLKLPTRKHQRQMQAKRNESQTVQDLNNLVSEKEIGGGVFRVCSCLPINRIWLPPWNRVLVEDARALETTSNNYSLRSILTIAFVKLLRTTIKDDGGSHGSAICSCASRVKKACRASPVFTFANQAGLDMLETTLVALQDIMLDKILNEAGRKTLCSEFSKIVQQVFFLSYYPLTVGIYCTCIGHIAWLLSFTGRDLRGQASFLSTSNCMEGVE